MFGPPPLPETITRPVGPLRLIRGRIIDLYSIAPINVATLKQAAKAANNLVLPVEEHYLHGGLCDAASSTLFTEGVRLYKRGIQEIAHNGKPGQLLDHYGINPRAIIEKPKQII